MHPFLTASATELARQIQTGATTSRQVVDAHIARITSVNPALNAMVQDRFTQARAEADAADAAQARGDALPPLHGVPCTIKESFAVRGMPNTGGLKSRVGTIATDDAITVKRLREAGAIVLGVTNLSELCMWMESANPVYGRTGNPYDPTRIAGGSSGGEGSIVGSGGSPFGLGADVGGSIRMPAFFNGVFGHKPGSGIVPNSGQFPINHSEAGLRMLATGPIARRAEDLDLLMRIMAGPDGEDTVCQPDAYGRPDTVRLDGLRVLSIPNNGALRVHPELVAAQQAAGAALTEMGADVRDAQVDLLTKSFDIWSTAMGDAEGVGAFRTLLKRPTKRELLPHLFRPHALGGSHTLPAIILGLTEDVSTAFPKRNAQFREMRHTLRAELIDLLGDGVLLYPPYTRPAPKHGAPLLRPFDWVYTAIFNAMGFPVTQVPLGLSREGLPLGVQVVARPGNDHVTIRVAEELERHGVAGWVPPKT